MIVGSIKEDLALEKRISRTPESAKNIIGLGLKVCIEKDYATILEFADSDYKNVGVEIMASSHEILNASDLIIKVNCPTDNEISLLKENSILVGMLNISKNKIQINKIISKNIKIFFIRIITRITRAQSMDVLSSQSNLAGYRQKLIVLQNLKKLFL